MTTAARDLGRGGVGRGERALDIACGVRARDEAGFELRRREVDAAVEHGVKVLRVERDVRLHRTLQIGDRFRRERSSRTSSRRARSDAARRAWLKTSCNPSVSSLVSTSRRS